MGRYGVGNATCGRGNCQRFIYACLLHYIPLLLVFIDQFYSRFPSTLGLNQSAWDSLNAFVRKTNVKLIFGLNQHAPAANLRALLEYSVQHNYSIFGLEPTNEEGCPPKQHTADLIATLR